MRHFAVVTSLLFAWLVPSSADAQRVVAETFMIAAADPGIQLHVRNRHLEGRNSFPGERVVLFVHGATYPSETVFDIDLPGGSWAEHVARKGYDVYLVDVRGYGRSMRPAAAPSGESAFRDDGRRGEGCRRGGRFHPQAPREDIVDYWGAGKATWEPEMIRVPTLLILAEWDQDTPLYMAQEVFAKLVNAPYKRHVVIGEGTHTVAIEKNRMHLINQVQSFLDEP